MSDYLLLAFSTFLGSFVGAMSKDLYEYIKKKLHVVKSKVPVRRM